MKHTPSIFDCIKFSEKSSDNFCHKHWIGTVFPIKCTSLNEARESDLADTNPGRTMRNCIASPLSLDWGKDGTGKTTHAFFEFYDHKDRRRSSEIELRHVGFDF